VIDFSQFFFSPVIDLPQNYEVYDFTKGYDANRFRSDEYGIGRYNEVRVGMYTTELFSDGRNVHMGIDIAAPVNTPIKSFYEGVVFLFDYNAADGDYGYTLIVEYDLGAEKLYALYGHLSKDSLKNKKIGQKVNASEVIAWVGDRHENGGWNPHLHFQLSIVKPEKCDMPGVVAQKDRESSLKTYPDPRLVLGPLY
jgi:peptidoglycan LD-endopeptidase LytH